MYIILYYKYINNILALSLSGIQLYESNTEERNTWERFTNLTPTLRSQGRMKYNECDGTKLNLAILELCMRKLYFEANRNFVKDASGENILIFGFKMKSGFMR